ncbi:MAG: beta-lactamase family protein [Defluviitaleaceae bacterium]|nr:beta-lactamase family protein [Defluviitaleaceae bacterium]
MATKTLENDIAIKLENVFTSWEHAEKFSGIISVVDNSGTQFEKVQGDRNRAEKLPNNRDTAFATASGTKLFTAAAICMLIDQNKLSLDSKICDILQYDLKSIERETTILNLLTHTSGIAGCFDCDTPEEEDEYFRKYPPHLLLKNEDYLPLFIDNPAEFKRGEQMGYSNSNFILLALAIEAIINVEFAVFIKENILDPLGMERTGFYAYNDLPANTALGYYHDSRKNKLLTNHYRIPIIGAGDGGIYTTVDDLKLFWRGLFGCKLFSKDMLGEMIAPRVDTDFFDGHMGLGVWVSKKNSERFYWHNGLDNGVEFCTAYFPKSECVLAIMANVNIPSWELQDEVMATICR